ncbi:hypothetical protein H0H81_001871 [Sphagnurus paluster]|uniref:Uncharacterized protein n=1 Tax=Sphagnurus paluster TaxID=117069 RepID=A0A9P7FSR8_9AGAR|nr:hypothetical protein H0H81_001871 [Sphagnurus paluster]
MNYRLQWGKRDNLSLLSSALEDGDEQDSTQSMSSQPCVNHKFPKALPALPTDAPKYFTRFTPREYLSIIQNDWPYSDVITKRIDQDGLCGFTGNTSPPPSPSTLPACLPALAAWGVTMEKLVRSEKGSEEEEEMVRRAGEEVHEFVRTRWNEERWETAWFVNPPRLQSVPGLAHIHVFARQKV